MLELGFQSFAWRFCHRSTPTQRRGPGLVLVSGLSPARLALEQAMQPLQIERQTDQTPLARSRVLATQRELSESQHLFDDADHRLNCAFAQPVDRLPDRGCELVGHLDLGTGILGWRRMRPSKALPPTRMVPIASGRDIGI